MALHCTVLRARELFVLRMRTLAIQYPDPWGKSAIPNKENSPPCPGWGEVGANIDRCIKLPTCSLRNIAQKKEVMFIRGFLEMIDGANFRNGEIQPLVYIYVKDRFKTLTDLKPRRF